MTEKELVDVLLNKSVEITGKFNNAVLEILRRGVNNSDNKIALDLIDSVEYSLEEIIRIIQR